MITVVDTEWKCGGKSYVFLSTTGYLKLVNSTGR